MLYPLRGRALLRSPATPNVVRIPGALVDCGTYNGGSTALLSAGAPRREIWAFDSFEGLPEPSNRDADRPLTDEEKSWAKGLCLGSEERLRDAVARFGAPNRLHVRKGGSRTRCLLLGMKLGQSPCFIVTAIGMTLYPSHFTRSTPTSVPVG